MGFAGHKATLQLWTRRLFQGIAWLLLVSGPGACAPAASQAPVPYSPVATSTVMPLSNSIATPVGEQIPEQRALILEWPSTIRVGDSDLILLTLDLDRQGNLTPTAMIEGHQIQEEKIAIPNLYETHYIFAEGRLDISGLVVEPNSEIIEALHPAQRVKLAWSVSPPQAGTFRGMVWLHLIFKPKQGGNEERQALSAQRIDIRAVNLMGLSGNAARWMGVIGAFLGSWLSFDSIAELSGKLWNIRRKKKLPTESDQ